MHVRVCKTCVSECGHIRAMLYMWRSEVSYQESLLSSNNRFHKPNLGSPGLGRSTFTHWAISPAFYFILWGKALYWTWNFLFRLDGLTRECWHQPFLLGWQARAALPSFLCEWWTPGACPQVLTVWALRTRTQVLTLVQQTHHPPSRLLSFPSFTAQ